MSSRPTLRSRIPAPARLIGALVAIGVTAALVPLVTSSASAAPAVGAFTPVSGVRLDAARARALPSSFRAFDLDLSQIRTTLAAAPDEDLSQASRGETSRITLPDPSGTATTFDIQQVPIMADELAAQHPEITAYAGRQVDRPGRTVAINLSPSGFSASVRALGGSSWYVDPAYRGRDGSTAVSYYADDLPADSEVLDEKELKDTGSRLQDEAETADTVAPRAAEAPGAVVVMKTYRVALVNDPAYATYFGAANVLAEKALLLNRVNQIYTQDVSLRMVMANGSDKLNLDTAAKATGVNGPCGASACYTTALLGSCSGDLLTRNEFAIGQLVGADEFDIGHITLGGGGGGIAGLGVVGEQFKADGCTGLATPDGDFFAIDFVAHEMGHEFGGNHTFNGVNGSCMGTNRNGDTSVEPGSGSSVMAYAGICFNDDLQAHTDPYFSQRSIVEFTDHITKTPPNYAEVQVVTLGSFGAGDAFTLSYTNPASGVTSTTAPFTSANFTDATIETAMDTLTGLNVSITPYDGAMTQNANGFTVSFPGAALNPPRFVFTRTTGDVTGFLGVTTQGGPSTNRGVETVTTNHAPTVNAGVDKTIPLRTPFVLTGSAVDTDAGDQAKLSYLWEQNDPGLGTGLLGAGDSLVAPDHATGPLFRVFGPQAKVTDANALEYMSMGENLADGNPSRSFPDRAQVLADNTNAETGLCTGAPAALANATTRASDATLECVSEFLPTATYAAASGELNFRLTARDNNAVAGGVQHDDLTLSIGTAGPFAVTSRAAAGTPAVGGATETIAWDVAQTNTATYATTVRILLSLDGGKTFSIVLADGTPNDGSQAVTLPDVTTSTARILVEAVGNYFYDTNDANFAINGTAVTTSPTVSTSATASPTVSTSATTSPSSTTSATASPSTSPSATVSPTRNPPITTSGTAEPTVTATGTPTATATGSATATATATATSTVTAGPTATTTVTQTVQPTPTATSTVTQTTGPTATSTVTQTVGPTPTATVTATVTETTGPTATATATQTVQPTPTASVTTTVTGGPTATATTTTTVRPTPTATVTQTTTAGPTATATVTQTVTASPTATTTVTSTTQPTVTVTPTVTATATATAPATGTATPTAQPTATAAPVPAGTVRTATRIRLPNPYQKVGGKRVKLQFQVVGGVLSTGSAGTALVRVDGRDLKSYAIAVTRKQGKKVVGFSVKVPRGLAAGRHTFQVTFTPAGTTSYLPSKSRLITLMVVGPARTQGRRVPVFNG